MRYGRHAVGVILFAVALFITERAWGYTSMGNDRILLMNNDNKMLALVSNQGYYDTNTSAKTYWVHTGPNVAALKPLKYLLAGTNHVMYAQDGTKYWELVNCRAGSASVINASRNYIPWSTSAKAITSPFATNIPLTDDGAGSVGSVILRNADNAGVYSPYYEEGIGTIYFDAVNAFVNAVNTHLVLEVATNVTAVASEAGISFDATLDDYEKMDWQICPFTLFTVKGTALTEIDSAATNVLLASTAGGSGLFYRMRAQLNYRKPIRFRIRRLEKDIGSIDSGGLVLIDNILASYPPMMAEFCRYGADYDDSLTGAEVLGCIGDFINPFLASKETGIRGHAFIDFYTNTASRLAVTVTNPRMMYRWRYLNQTIENWQALPFDQTSLDSITHTTSNLVTTADVPLNNGVGDIEYYFTAELDAPFYSVKDYAFNTSVGYGPNWTEGTTAITNRAVYSTAERKVPTGGTDYFVRIREGESNIEWVRIVGELSIVTNAATGACVTNQVDKRMALVDHHLWRYHYEIPTNGVGARLTFKLVAKEHYTNETDSATWHVRTNELFASDEEISSLPYTATLSTNNTHEMSVVLDDASTHLKIEYNDEQAAFAFSHASYQNFKEWTDAVNGFVGHSMVTNGTDVVSDSGVASTKKPYIAPFNNTWKLPSEYNRDLWTETFHDSYTNTIYKREVWFSIGQTPDNGWTAHNARYVASVRGDRDNMALAIDGLGEGALATENFSETELPMGLESVSFTARIAQPIQFENFATYMDGLSSKNYAISAKVTMSQDYVATGHFPKDISPVYPSISLVGYHRWKQGCYEFRMTRTDEDTSGNGRIRLDLYKWTKSGSATKATLLKSEIYTGNILMPTTSTQMSASQWTTAYFLVYTLPSGAVRLEGHLAPSPTTSRIDNDLNNMRTSNIWYVDTNPGSLAKGGSYGVGSTDCRAGFGGMKIHTNIPTAPTDTADAVINAEGTSITKDQLANEWDFYETRWEVANFTSYAADGCLMGVVPTNQSIQVWVSDSEAGASSGWQYSGYETVINSFTTNSFKVWPKLPGTWKVRLQTKEDEDAGVVLDDVALTAWEGLNVWGREDRADTDYDDDWVFTKGWVSNKVGSTEIRECLLQPARGKVGYPMGLRSPYISEGLSLFSFSYKNADSNCVMYVQIATNMAPREGTQDVADLTVLTESDVDEGYIWTTVATHDFRTMDTSKLKGDTLTTFISLRQHNIYDRYSRTTVLTNVCGLIRVIVDPAIVKKVVEASAEERVKLENYGKITLTEAHCYNEPAIDLKSWFGWNVHTEGWDGAGNASKYAYLTDYPDGLSIALNFSAKQTDNTSAAAQGIGLAKTSLAAEYEQQNPFVQCAALTNGIGTVSFRARLFDPGAADGRAVITLYGGTDPGTDQPTTDSRTWHMLTNFVVTSSTYQPFSWTTNATESIYKAVRLSAAGARWGRYPSGQAADWEWGNIPESVKQEPINRVFIDEMSASEVIAPRVKFLDVRPFRTNLGTEDICVVTDITSESQQPLIAESWGIQCRVEPQQMADELDKDSITVYMEVFRGEIPWGYEQWKNLPEYDRSGRKQRFTSKLARVGDTLIYRSHYTIPQSIMEPESNPNTVYQYMVRAVYRKNGEREYLPAQLRAEDWKTPFWYRGSRVGAGNASGDEEQFSAYTILDAISPRRAWVNEVNYVDGENTCLTNQFIELALPQAANVEGWKLYVTSRDGRVANLVTLGSDDGVSGRNGTRNISSVAEVVAGRGEQQKLGEDFTNHYTFVSLCAKSTWDYARASGANPYDGYWRTSIPENTTLNEGRLQYYEPYGIQLIRPSGVIEHEFVVEGTNVVSDLPAHAWMYSGTNMVSRLLEEDPSGQWFYAGEDVKDANTSLGVWRGHGEDAVPSNWTNWMYCTPGKINKLKDGTLQEIPDWFIEPNGTNVWIYSYLADGYVKQYFGGNDMGSSAVIVIPKDTETNLVLSVTNWYQIGACTTNGATTSPVQVEGMRGRTGDRIVLNLGKVQETLTINIGSEPQSALSETWGLTPENRYTPAVISWLMDKYQGYGPEDLSAAELRTLSFESTTPNPTWLSLTEMYWLDIPPVHSDPVYGGSNIWFLASMGTVNSPSSLPVIESHVTESGGVTYSNVYLTVTMMITNTSRHAEPPRAWPPYQMNGLVYDGEGSRNYAGRQAWTSVVFSVTGALQKDGVKSRYLPLQQYVFRPDSFGVADSDHPFQTRIEVMDPFAPNTLGYYYGWPKYRDVYPVWYRWSIKDDADGRVSVSPLVPNWTPPSP